jgi:bifunctional glutamyl/prolyl-tRNA synthetase
MRENQYVAVRRDTGEKIVMRKCGMEDDLPALLNTIQSALFARARTEMADHLKVAHTFQEFLQHLDNSCLIQVNILRINLCS